MIVWLASYPRSGNTLFRITLQQLGLGPTYSVHDDPALKKLSINEEVGHIDLPEGGINKLALDKHFHFVKTHTMPGNDEYPTVYIVRDGRDSIVSYAHYLREVEQKNVPLPQLIAGLISGDTGGFGSWSDHIRKWRRKKGPAVMVRFEDLVEDPVGVVRDTLGTIGIPILNNDSQVKVPSFSELQSKSSKFFRKGRKGGWAEDLDTALERQFWRWNRMGMALAGYEKPSTKLPHAAQALPGVEPEDIVGKMEAVEPILDEICMPPYYGPENNKDFDFLINLAIKSQPKTIFEFGTASGNTAANLCRYTSANVFTLNAVRSDTSGNHRTYDLSIEQIGSVYTKYGYQDRVHQIYCDSMNFLPEAIADTELDLVVIDACHDFEYILNDFLTIRHLVSPGGYVLFHDCDETMIGHLEGCWRACTHLRKAGFNIKQVKGTWWAIWSPSDQDNQTDSTYISLLDYEIEKTREQIAYKTRINAELELLRSKLNLIKKLPAARLLLWVQKRLSS